ncbi:MAG TPA: dolichyl-phosphate beta-glucosyltransferase [Actinomycetota bacterium]|nr:dolichyl-phosphate beta-glucosyltransferase [Actinomycetota bacterium]
MTALTIVLPCYQEADRLPTALERYLAHFSAGVRGVELLVVDDGSTDQTLAVAEAIAARDRRVRVLRCPTHRGKGFAVRTGMLAGRGDRLVFTDADASYGPDQVERVLRALDGAPVAIGRRGDLETSGPVLRRLASRVFNQAMRRLLGLPFRDTQCGLKGFRRDAARELFGRTRVDGFAFDAEVLFLARRLGLTVAEVPVSAELREGSKVRLAVDALRMLRDTWRVRRAAAGGLYDRAVAPVRGPAI